MADAFEVNMHRLRLLAETSAEVAMQARRDAALLFYTEYKITGKIAGPPFTEEAKKVPDTVPKEFHRILNNFVASLTPEQHSQFGAPPGG